MRRIAILLAAALVLAADVFVVVKEAQNRSGSPIATIELTEWELRLVRPQRESTALFLELAWEPVWGWGRFKFEDGPGWFNQAKLEEVGYDCRLAPSDPSAAANYRTMTAAAAHYRAMTAKEAFVVLEYSEAGGGGVDNGRSSRSRLVAVDAGRSFAPLRKKYPDARFLIVPSLVRLLYIAKWDPNTRKDAPGAYLRGAVVEMLVGQISVPPSQRSVLQALSQTTSDYLATPEARARGPRYSVVLHYGRNYEPWIGSCRLLASARQ
ncbi:MAG: DUF4824 family protein [Bryobacteraceae bacterium]|jgi:hypothetical protein